MSVSVLFWFGCFGLGCSAAGDAGGGGGAAAAAGAGAAGVGGVGGGGAGDGRCFSVTLLSWPCWMSLGIRSWLAKGGMFLGYDPGRVRLSHACEAVNTTKSHHTPHTKKHQKTQSHTTHNTQQPPQ